MELALRPHLLIEEARERQRRRRARFALAVAVLAVLAAAGYALSARLGTGGPTGAVDRAALPNPCALLTNAAVENVFGAKVAYRTAKPEYGACSWSGWPFPGRYGEQTVSLDVAAVSRAEFQRAFSTFVVFDGTPGARRVKRATRVLGVGDAALAQSFAGTTLFVWYRGVEFSVTTGFVPHQLGAEKRLARAVVERMRELEART